MKKTILSHSMAVLLLTIVGSLAAQAKVIIPFGQVYQQPFEAKYYYAVQGAEGPGDTWFALDFDDTSWGTLTMPISSEGTITYYNTVRPNERCRYWVRKYFNLTSADLANDFFIQYAHDDECTLYLNGTKLFDENGAANYNIYRLTETTKALLQAGENVLCMYVYDSGGGGMYMDFGLYEDEGDFQDIVKESNLPVSFTNDTENPWLLNGVNAINGNQGKNYSTSTLQMTFTNTYTAELKFDWFKYRYYNGGLDLQLYIDGVLMSSTTNGSWTTPRFYIQPGEHVVTFRDTIGSDNYRANSGLRNIILREIYPLQTAVLTANSMPLTFQNNSATPWTIEDGFIEHNNYGVANTGSSFFTTFTLDKTSKLSFERRVSRSDNNYNYEDRHNLFVYINGIQITKDWDKPNYEYWCVALEPGEYTVEWKDTIYNRGEWYYSQIRNIELSNNWIDVELASAGTLGYEVLYSGKANVLDDAEFVKVTGPMNANDWTDIKNMNNLKALDLSEAIIAEIPNNAFDGKSWLNSVIMPEGITRIGEYAFRGTNIRKVNIPSTVTTIGRNAFIGTPVQYVTFAENSQIETIGIHAFESCTSLQNVDLSNVTGLTTLGHAAFAGCSQLKEFIMPNSVTTIAPYLFQNCSQMKKLVFSDALTEVRDYVCYGCTSLEEVHLPQNLKVIWHESFINTTSLRSIEFPASLEAIQYNAFENSGLESVVLPITLKRLSTNAFRSNANLKYIEMPSHLVSEQYNVSYRYYDDGSVYYTTNQNYGYRDNFSNCKAIETIVMRSATPPSIVSDPFVDARSKSLIELVVPSFAVVNYKLDTYWKQFGSIVEGDDVDYWMITSPLMLTNNRRMQGKPDIDLYFGGQLTVGGSAPMPTGQFNYYVNESNPGRLLNTCDALTADNAATMFAVEANKWFFFTPLYDVNIADIEVSNGASYVFRYYDAQNRAANGASGSWKNVDTDKLVGGQGYIFHCNTACTITFPADATGRAKLFNTGDVTRQLTVNEAESTANRSWNYVGNPYPAYYDIYYMDFTAPITVWNGSTYKAYSIADDQFVLRPMQAFFVQKPDAVDNIIFHKEGRQLTTDINHLNAAPRANATTRSNRCLFDIQIESSELSSDETRVVLNSQAQMSYEVERDAAKFMSSEPQVPQLYTFDTEGNSYAINERPIDNGQVSLAYYAGQADNYTIRALRTDGTVSLYDSETDTTIDLTTEEYTFYSDPTNGINTSRFTLTFTVADTTPTDIEGIDVMHDASQTRHIYDLQGRRVDEAQKGIFIEDGKKIVRK